VGGAWAVTVTYPRGESSHTLTLTQTGDAVTGTHKGEIFTGTVRGMVRAGTVELRSNLANPATILLIPSAARSAATASAAWWTWANMARQAGRGEGMKKLLATASSRRC